MTLTHELQAKKYTEAAEQALRQDNPAAAVNAYRLALVLLPDDLGIKQSLAEAVTAAESILAENYVRQAAYEEKNEHWEDAAKSLTRLAKIRTKDAGIHHRAALALLRSAGDLHEAANFAKRAVSLLPTDAGFRMTLAEIYLAAGLPKNARRELEAAEQLSPHDATISTLLKRIGKAG